MINREHLKKLNSREEERFLALHPKSGELFEKAKGVMPGGVPMSWMTKWPGKYPLFVEKASGARFTDVDGNELCHVPNRPSYVRTSWATRAF